MGGAVADHFGWRMAFWIQIPAIAIATVLVIWKVDVPRPASDESAWSKICRIDWAGSFVLIVSVSH